MRLAAALLLLLSLGIRHSAFGTSITGADWVLHFNLPDANNAAVTSEEFTIRDALVGRLQALQTNQQGWLATYTWSGSNTTTGAGGPILNALQGALDRGARIAMAVDSSVDTASRMGGSNTLAGLAARPANPLTLVEDDSASGIMHHKLGVFDYGTSRWVMAGSWNFTQAACTFQWNVMLELRSDAVFTAYTNEMAELLAGRFHDHTNKSHAHDQAAFRLADSWTNDFVRFGPYPDDRSGGTNALTDITNIIGHAESQIVFALNQITRLQVATSLVQACNRGVEVVGTIPLSDALNASSSLAVYSYLTNSANYASTNLVQWQLAYESALGAALDDGSESDLVHAKWMVVDPFGARPVAILGSANWTDSALASKSANDENVLFLHHREIARALYAHLKRMARTLNDRSDFTFTHISAGQVGLRPTDTNLYLLEQSSGAGASWTNVGAAVTGQLSGLVWPVDTTATTRWFRARRGP